MNRNVYLLFFGTIIFVCLYYIFYYYKNENEYKCNLGNVKSCLNAAYDYADKNNYEKSVQFLKKACKLGHAESCFFVAEAYYDGKKISKDYDKAFKYFKKACDLGNDDACYYLRNRNTVDESVNIFK
jgi:hypothetical protein